MSFLAYFLTMLSSPKRNNDLLTVKQFCRTGMGLYRAIVRARCALVCLKAPGDPPAGAAAPCRLRFCSEPPSPEPSLPATASPKRAILQESAQVSRAAPPRRRGLNYFSRAPLFPACSQTLHIEICFFGMA